MRRFPAAPQEPFRASAPRRSPGLFPPGSEGSVLRNSSERVSAVGKVDSLCDGERWPFRSPGMLSLLGRRRTAVRGFAGFRRPRPLRCP
ncbi:hypothetical protein NDU88_008294 [Pleurodeles waltl]|uniref:Uncharacterized protein n=1 Tax=Pleurodeles waltl TaxID=8319 RepID=A0AAV7NXF1_PLEWA|nr:hypothetical protein NDU88_008294 [Pleurodeles waltl]